MCFCIRMHVHVIGCILKFICSPLQLFLRRKFHTIQGLSQELPVASATTLKRTSRKPYTQHPDSMHSLTCMPETVSASQVMRHTISHAPRRGALGKGAEGRDSRDSSTSSSTSDHVGLPLLLAPSCELVVSGCACALTLSCTYSL